MKISSFYVNLPIGAVTLAVLILVLKLPRPPLASAIGLRQKIRQLDPLGTLFFLPSIVCLLLALQWGGTTYQWHSARIIALLVLFGVLMIAFVFVQGWKKEKALLPLHILKQRSIATGTMFSACVGGSMLLFVYYLPIWFQSIKGVNAVKSGIDIIPLLLGLFTASLLAGALTSLIGYYTPFMVASCVIMGVGAGLLTTFTPTSNSSEWIGYQALFGIGIGLGFQQPSVAAQAVLHRKDVPTGSSLVMFAQSLGGAISVSIGGNVYTNAVVSHLVGIPDLDPATVINSGATALTSIVPAQYIGAAKDAYNAGLTGAFRVGLVFACVSIFGAIGMEWISVKRKPANSGLEGGAEGNFDQTNEKKQPEEDEKVKVAIMDSADDSKNTTTTDEENDKEIEVGASQEVDKVERVSTSSGKDGALAAEQKHPVETTDAKHSK